jgi:hypothetical protein
MHHGDQLQPAGAGCSHRLQPAKPMGHSENGIGLFTQDI